MAESELAHENIFIFFCAPRFAAAPGTKMRDNYGNTGCGVFKRGVQN